MFLFAGMAVYHLCTWSPQGQKRAADLLELKLRAVVSYHLIAGCWGWDQVRSPRSFLTAELSPQPLVLGSLGSDQTQRFSSWSICVKVYHQVLK